MFSNRLVVRIRADDPTADNLLGVKFGCSVAKACGLLRTAKKMNLDVIGVRSAILVSEFTINFLLIYGLIMS